MRSVDEDADLRSIEPVGLVEGTARLVIEIDDIWSPLGFLL